MKNKLLFWIMLLGSVCPLLGGEMPGTMSFVVSAEHPDMHRFHVEFHCDGFPGETEDFKMPAWTPGYYRIMNYARNVTNFTAQDGAGHPLTWKKTATNTWRVHSAGVPAVTVSYDVATRQPIFESSLSNERGFVAPTDLFMNLAGQIQHPVTVTLKLPGGWTNIATGLDPVPGKVNTFSAPDFDILYDCPILMGKLDILRFDVHGIPHEFAGVNLGDFDRAKFVSDLQRMVEAATGIIGEIPYQHYTFIVANANSGGIEHLNSTTIGFRGASVTNAAGNKREMAFIAHEFFHLYNVKRIRPVELGPFDYDHENRTRLLWISEGFTDYYAWITLLRAGLIEQKDMLGDISAAIAKYENVPGHLFQSAAQSSLATWVQQPFGRTNAGANMTISYYDKGSVLGALLDLKIRHESKNRKSLDDVMRALYQDYYKEKRRGFTEQEFRQVCERAAGARLGEFFDYANTTRDINYRKYFNYAGLDIAMPKKLPQAALGVNVRARNGKLIVSSVDWGSNAAKAGIAAQDELVSLNGTAVTGDALGKLMTSMKPGQSVEVVYSHNAVPHNTRIRLGNKMERTFRLTPQPHPDALQAAIFKDWLRTQ